MSPALLLRADWDELPRLTAWLDAALEGWTEREAYAVRLCVEELAGNVLLHGTARSLQVSLVGPPARLVVADDGPAFDPSAVARPSLPASLDDARPGGLGLLLARSYSRGFDYARLDGWNRVTVRF